MLLLKAGAWEDALVLVRSPYELNVNLSEIATAQDPEAQFIEPMLCLAVEKLAEGET